MLEYNKGHLSVDEQVDLLASRGMQIPDREVAHTYLRTVGYFRLAGYWHDLRIPIVGTKGRLSGFVETANLDDVVELYEFDRQLRLIVFDAIERIEVLLKFHLAHVVGLGDPFAHRDKANYAPWFCQPKGEEPSRLEKLMKRIQYVETRSREVFVEHHVEKYGEPLPIWKSMEVLGFREISELYSGLNQRLAERIAFNLGIVSRSGSGNSGVLGKWLAQLDYVRNLCAHHSRLWNRNMDVKIPPTSLKLITHAVDSVDIQMLFRTGEIRHATSRIFASLAVMGYFLDQIEIDHEWRNRLTEHIYRVLPVTRSLSEMGFWSGKIPC